MFKRVSKTAILPQAQTKYSAGYDVYADENVIIEPNETKAISLGIAIDNDYLKNKCLITNLEDAEEVLQIAQQHYPNFRERIEDRGYFEFELYYGQKITDELIKELGDDYDIECALYYLVEFDKSKYENFMKTYYVGLHIRSSLALKGLMITNGYGIIDIDYKDEIKMILHNSSNKTFDITQGQRIGQLIIHKHYGNELLDSDFRKNTSRVGGFGSTKDK